MSVLLRTEGVHKSYGGVQALDTARSRSARAGGRPDRAERIGQDHAVQRHHRVRKADAGEVYLGGRRITNSPPDKVFALGIGRTFQLTRIFPASR